jgi:8-oxo-dGTP pyrophosphatase MutT (NUDIX family)
MDANDWPVLDEQIEHRNPYFSVERLRVELPSGRPNDYYRIRTEKEAAIAVGTHDGRLVMVNLYRPRIDGSFVEFPGGGIDKGEDPETAALREFTEETGYEGGDPERLGSFYHSPWNPAEQHVVWVGETEPPASEWDESEPEVTSVVEVFPSEVIEYLGPDPIPSWSVSPLLMAWREGKITLDGING